MLLLQGIQFLPLMDMYVLNILLVDPMISAGFYCRTKSFGKCLF